MKSDMLATVGWQQLSVGNNRKMNQGHELTTLSCISQNAKQLSFFMNEWKAASLFLSEKLALKSAEF
jgi:hypothetical protein